MCFFTLVYIIIKGYIHIPHFWYTKLYNFQRIVFQWKAYSNYVNQQNIYNKGIECFDVDVYIV